MAKNLSMQFTIQALQANKNAPEKLSEAIQSTGGRIRTLNLLIRSQVLYPIELRPHGQDFWRAL